MMLQALRVRQAKRAETTLLTRPFVAVSLAALAYFTGDGILIAALPRYVTGPLGGGNIAVGIVVGAFSVSAFVLRPWAGGFGDRRGRRPLMLIGAVLFAASVLGYALAVDAATLTALRLVTGAGEALFFVGVVAAVTDLAPPERRGEAMSLASLSLYIGIGTGPLIGELAIDRFGFTTAWLLAAAAGLVALGLVLRVRETRPEIPVAESGAAPGRNRLVHPAGLVPGVVLLASILGMAGFLAFVPLHALDLGMSGARYVLLAFAAVVVVIRSAGARLPDQLGPARATRIALTLSAAGLALIGAWHTPVGLMTGAVVLGAGVALLTPSVFALAVERVSPQERGSVIGTTSAFLDLALGLGPATLGIVGAALGRPGTFLAGAAVAAAGLLFVVILKVGHAPAADPEPSSAPELPGAAPEASTRTEQPDTAPAAAAGSG
jgi:MFS family permease